ncbi:MAG: outer membrane protein assembly factor BamE [Pseudomonadota bacterium]
MQKILISSALAASLILPACSSLHVPGVHRIDIQQGNVITQEMVDKLKPGMDKNQVRFALGTPTIVDVFHQERWDYVYSFQPGGGERQQRHLALFFDGDRLVRIEGDVQPGAGTRGDETPTASSEPGAGGDTAVTVHPPAQKKGLFEGLKSAIGLGKEDDLMRAPASAEGDRAAPDETTAEPEAAETPAP